jgi:hypothetical protein
MLYRIPRVLLPCPVQGLKGLLLQEQVLQGPVREELQ